MTWQPYESQGITIDMALADKLNSYLEGKETELCAKISLFPSSDSQPILIPSESISLRLHDVIEEFGKKVQRLSQAQQKNVPKEEWKVAAKAIQQALWQYIEVLKESTAELFQQLDHIGFDHWDTQLSSAMTAINETLMHRMNDLIWAIKRLEQQLQKLKSICKKLQGNREWWTIGLLGRRVLDSSMESTIIKCRKFLEYHYQEFSKKYQGYQVLYAKAEHSLQKFHSYRRLASLELEAQDHLKHIKQHLKIWDCNLKLKALPRNEISRTLKSAYSPEFVINLFWEYYGAIKKGLFEKSRMIKKKFREVFHDHQAREPIIHNISGYRVELEMLAWMSAKYRALIMATDSGSYPRLRFSEKSGESDSKNLKQLQMLTSYIENLNSQCENFQSALESDQAMQKLLIPEANTDIGNLLSEMAQPLISKTSISEHAKKVLEILKSFNELTSFDPEVVKYTCKILCKVMRTDWKYHIVQEISLFHELYDIHHGIVGPLEERQHAERLIKFKNILMQFDHWLENKETLKHVHEVNLGINDIKAYLQDFYVSIQGIRELNEKNDAEGVLKALDNTSEAVLEYRYVFSKFFHRLHSGVPEERRIRQQFIFVDQYLEAIENRLHEINASW